MVFYSINVTLSPTEFSLYSGHVARCLNKVYSKIILQDELRITFFVDIHMMQKLRSTNINEYFRVQHLLNKMHKNGHDIGIYINMDWEQKQDIHFLDNDAMTDLFIHGKDEIMQIMNLDKNKHKLRKTLRDKLTDKNIVDVAVRVSNGKINPFVYLQEAYAFVNIKLDTSIPARQAAPRFYDYKKIPPGRVYRFGDNATQQQRFGKYLELPRAVYRAGSVWVLGVRGALKKYIKKFGAAAARPFVKEESAAACFESKTLFRTKNAFFLSPDVLTTKYFLKSIDKTKTSSRGIMSIESFLTTLSPLSLKNLESLFHPEITFMTAQDIIKKFGLSTNNIVFK